MLNLLRRGKLHAAEVQLLHRRISMPSLGTYSSTSLSQHISLNQVTVKNLSKRPCHQGGRLSGTRSLSSKALPSPANISKWSNWCFCMLLIINQRAPLDSNSLQFRIGLAISHHPNIYPKLPISFTLLLMSHAKSSGKSAFSSCTVWVAERSRNCWEAWPSLQG